MDIPNVFGLKGMALSALAGGLVMASVSVWATGIYYRADIAELKLEKAETHDANTTAALKQFQQATAKIANAANRYGALQNTMSEDFRKILEGFQNVRFKNPLPVDCKPDAERLRNLNAAVTAANQFAAARQ